MVPLLHCRLAAVLVLALGLAQALDSGIRHAPPHVIAIVALALAVPALAFWLTGRPGVHLTAGALSLVTVVFARVISPVPLPTLALAGWFPAIAAIFLANAAKRGQKDVMR